MKIIKLNENIPDVKLNIEPIETVEQGPATEYDTEISTLLIGLINSKWNFVSELNNHLISLKDKNNEEITSKMSNINNEWEKRYGKLAYYIEHDELEKVGTEITRLSAYINVQEYDEAQNETATTVFILQHIEDKEKFSVRSIF